MKNKNEAIKTFNIRLPKEIWVFLKKLSIKQELTMNVIILNLIIALEKKHKKRLTNNKETIL